MISGEFFATLSILESTVSTSSLRASAIDFLTLGSESLLAISRISPPNLTDIEPINERSDESLDLSAFFSTSSSKIISFSEAVEIAAFLTAECLSLRSDEINFSSLEFSAAIIRTEWCSSEANFL